MARRIGVDVGSKTIKVVVLDDDGRIVRSAYRRHRSTIRVTLATVLREMVDYEGDEAGSVAFTGSAGIAASALVCAPFVQEVVATTGALRALYPQADAALELGGEDAKVIYLTGGLEQRMNASCAGGTGGFVDTIAFSLGVRASDMNRLAQQATRRYSIASRCAVFAQTDVRPLLNAGVDRADIAASALDAVVRQTIGGLACGRPLRGTVVLLGGPIAHIPYLADRFRATLGLDEAHGIVPNDAHLLVAVGAALAGEGATSLSELAARFAAADLPDDGFERLPALFETEADRRAFEQRHAAHRYPRRPLSRCEGALYAGFDAGSTAVKLAVVDARGSLAYSDCRPVRGDAAGTAAVMLKALYRELGDAVRRRAVVSQRSGDAVGATPPYLARVVATGYGEKILVAGLGVDAGVVETAAHARCAAFAVPDATFLLDIGGQDIKALWLSDGVVVDAVLNEACSSGCGAFLEGTAYAAGSTPVAFSQAALRAESPIDLGTRCTVFMTSRVRHAQKSGARIADIAAGASYSVVRNAFDRVVGRTRARSMGDRIVVQGGAFSSDAVLRAFELSAGHEAVRLDVAQLSGAIGAALIARDECTGDADARSGVADMSELAYFSPKREHARCEGCDNACELVVVLFGTGRAAVEGARCERGMLSAARRFGARVPAFGGGFSKRPPNTIAAEQVRLARCSDETGRGPRACVRVGLIGVLDGFSTLPFWHALLHELGFSVIVPTAARVAACADDALETVGAEGACWPAKRSHARLLAAVRAGADAVFAPRLARGRRCAVRASYADALATGFGFGASEGEGEGEVAVRTCGTGAAAGVRMVSPLLASARPERICWNAADRASITRALSALCPFAAISEDEIARALERARAAWEAFCEAGAREVREALAWVKASPERIGLVFASRPYLVDADVLHGIDEAAREQGFAVIGGIGVDVMIDEEAAARGDARDAAWPCAQRLVDRARFAARRARLEVVCVRSFGCGYDAEAVEEARADAAASGRAVMSFTVDEIADLAHIGIRMRTLAFFAKRRMGCAPRTAASAGVPANICFTAELLARRLVADAGANSDQRRFEVPGVCERCQLDAVGAIASRATGRPIEVAWTDPAATFAEHARALCAHTRSEEPDGRAARPRVGVVGSALLCFDEAVGGEVVRLLERLGCEAVLPSASDAVGDDVRYLRQFDRLYADGVRDVVYLQSFGCLKANVAVRGGARELARRYPGIRLTIVDFDAEASALNRENRIRLAVEAAKTRDNGFDRPRVSLGPEGGR